MNISREAFSPRPAGNIDIHSQTIFQETLFKLGAAHISKLWPPQENSHSFRKKAKVIETVAYFLGHEIACEIWADFPSQNPALPFTGVEKLALPTDEPQNILLIGCAGSASYKLEQEKLNEAGVKINTHTTIDISLFPLNRITKSLSKNKYGITNQMFLNADAADMPFPNCAFDIALTDLMFGSIDREQENNILDEAARVTKKGGILVMRASNFSDKEVEGITPYMNDIGNYWQGWAREKYGKDRLTTQQWMDFGMLYSSFIRKHYFNKNRFKTPQEIESFLERGNKFKIEKCVENLVKIPFMDDEAKYLTIKATRIG